MLPRARTRSASCRQVWTLQPPMQDGPSPIPGGSCWRLVDSRGTSGSIGQLLPWRGREPAFRLAVVGEGPARDRLLAHVSDLQGSSRVRFVGVADAELYRWLRTASVLVALAEHESSGPRIAEALWAGAPVVASDIPVHREVASYAGSGRVRFVAPAGLDVADEIREAVDAWFSRMYLELPTWGETVERTLALYTRAVREIPQVVAGGG
jgi:glycosyltransferase involved in cell wall biosynthesis